MVPQSIGPTGGRQAYPSAAKSPLWRCFGMPSREERAACRIGRQGTALSDSAQSDGRAWYRTERRNSVLRVTFGGNWVIEQITALDKSLRALELDGARDVEFDGSEIQRMDSAGAWLILRAKHQLSQAGAQILGTTVPDAYRP